MRKYLLLLVSLLSLSMAAQTDSLAKNKQKKISFIPEGRIYAFYPFHFGEHAMADAYDPTVALGLNISFFRYQDFRLLLGYEHAIYKVADVSKIGLVDRSTYKSFNFSVAYKIGNKDSFSINPTVGIAPAILKLKSGKARFGRQEALDLRAGFTADYSLDKHLGIFLGVNYIHSNIDVNTSSEFYNYFSKANQVQFSIGLQFK